MTKFIEPSIRIETFSSPKTGYAGEAYSSAGGGHTAQERISYPKEPIEVVKAHSSSTDVDTEQESNDQESTSFKR